MALQKSRPIKKAVRPSLSRVTAAEEGEPVVNAASDVPTAEPAQPPVTSQPVGSPLSDVGRKLLSEERDRLRGELERLDDQIRNAEEGLRISRAKREEAAGRLSALESDLT